MEKIKKIVKKWAKRWFKKKIIKQKLLEIEYCAEYMSSMSLLDQNCRFCMEVRIKKQKYFSAYGTFRHEIFLSQASVNPAPN